MKCTFNQFQAAINNFTWDIQTLADNLSAIGFETEVHDQHLDIAVLSNRPECKIFQYLVYDLAGIYDLMLIEKLEIKPGRKVFVTKDQVAKLLGFEVSDNDYQKLSRLGFNITDESVTPPDFRTDIETTADIAEEVGRMIGYQNIQPQPLTPTKPQSSPNFEKIMATAIELVAAGLTETRTDSFASTGLVTLNNPFTETEPFLRDTLLTGLLKTLAKNPFMKRAAFFEIGDIYLPEEEKYLGIIMSGYKDISELQANIEQILDTEVVFVDVPAEDLAKHNVTQPRVKWCQIPLSKLAIIHKELDWQSHKLKKIKPISKFPPLVRDVTISSSDDEVKELVIKLPAEFPTLLFAEIVDRYEAPGSTVPSLTIRGIFQKIESSFTQDEITSLSEKFERYLSKA